MKYLLLSLLLLGGCQAAEIPVRQQIPIDAQSGKFPPTFSIWEDPDTLCQYIIRSNVSGGYQGYGGITPLLTSEGKPKGCRNS